MVDKIQHPKVNITGHNLKAGFNFNFSDQSTLYKLLLSLELHFLILYLQISEYSC